jgi:hypothetical protein
MNNVLVCIYSYKGKYLKDVVYQLRETQSNNNNIKVVIWDQNPLDRSKFFPDENYNHVLWDQIISPSVYKNLCIKDNFDYILFISDEILLNESWDEKLINLIKDKDIVLSGNKKIKIKSKNLFYLDKEYFENIEELSLTNFIDRSFVFASKDIINKIKFPEYIKYHGEEEILSLKIFSKKINVYSVSQEIYSKHFENSFISKYVPFSLDHNYNDAIDLLRHGYNRWENLGMGKKICEEFSQFHDFNFKQIEYLPFLKNDVEYDPYMLNFDRVDSRRFVARTKAIH